MVLQQVPMSTTGVNAVKRILTVIALLFVVSSLAFAGPSTNQQTPSYQDTAVSPTFTTNQVAIGHSGAFLVKAAPGTTPKSRFSITIKNIGSYNIYIGSTNAVTSSTGMRIGAGESFTLDRSYSAIYAICGGTDNSTVAYLEEAR